MAYSIFNSYEDQLSVAEYLEYFVPVSDGDTSSYADGYIEFRYSEFVNEKGYFYPITGLKTRQKTLTIETTSDLPFKPEDRVRFNGDPKQVYKIESVAYQTEDIKKRTSFLFKNSESRKRKIIVLV
jgi:hypothetical protein